MENLNEFRVQELTSEEHRELNGGGWLADFVSDFVYLLNCNCYDISSINPDVYSAYYDE